LTVPELIDGTAVELGDNSRLNPAGRLFGEDAICSVCPGLIEVDARPDDEISTVRIAHFSVQEYLESDRILQHKAAPFRVRKLETDAEIASICLTYLLEPALSRDSMEKYPLALYAAKTWHEHFRDGGKNTHARHQALRLFRSSRGEFENWVTIWNVDAYDGRKPSGKVPSPVYYASLLGLDLVLSKLLCEKPSGSAFSALSLPEISDLVNAQGGYYGNALQAASRNGHEKVVEQLLDKGTDVNAQGGRYGNALEAASQNGREKVVELLLDKGADVNAQGGICGNALQAASRNGHEKVVEQLLDKGTDVNAQGGRYGNALQAASVYGHEKVVELLLDKGADVNAQGGDYGNALQAASAYGREKVVELLLGRGAAP